MQKDLVLSHNKCNFRAISGINEFDRFDILSHQSVKKTEYLINVIT